MKKNAKRSFPNALVLYHTKHTHTGASEYYRRRKPRFPGNTFSIRLRAMAIRFHMVVVFATAGGNNVKGSLSNSVLRL